MAEPRETDEGAAVSVPRVRAFTVKALMTGLLLVVFLALAIPWNDWALQNTQLYSNYLPPVVTVVMLSLALVVNPLLGGYRFRRAEMVVVAVMLLGLGGVVSGGLVRVLPGVMTAPARHFALAPSLSSMQTPLSPEEIAAVREQVRLDIQYELNSYDANDSGSIELKEYPRPSLAASIDSDGDGTLAVEEVVSYRASQDPHLLPTERWPVPTDMVLGVPDAGPIPTHDTEYRFIVDGYLDGLPAPEGDQLPRVTHRSLVTWVAAGGERYERQIALSGAVRHEFRQRGEAFLDLDDPRLGGLLRYRRAQETVALPSGEAVFIEAVEPPALPWYAWLPALATWAPLLVGAFVVMIAIAGVVRHQWLHNERLPYPIATVTLELMAEPETGRRYAALFYHRGFWVAATIAIGIIVWRGLFTYNILPVNIPTSLQLWSLMDGQFFQSMPNAWWFSRPALWFSIVGMTYFMSLQVSFSLWFTAIAANALFAILVLSGLPLEKAHFQQSTVGGFGMLALLIIWLGRRHYWQVLKAACGIERDPAARAAAPYLWAMIIGGATMVGFLLWQGAPLGGSLLLLVLFVGILLVISRIVAESGMPFCQSSPGNRIDPVLFTLFGTGVAPVMLMPLALVGCALGPDNREALMPYAMNASAMGDRAGVRAKRLSLAMLAAVVLGCLVAFGSMVWAGYRGGGATVDFWPMYVVRNHALDPVATIAEAAESTEAMVRLEGDNAASIGAYGFGAGVVGVLGWARMMFSWWPLHPIGFILMASWCTASTWASIMVGWLWKGAVMRYGGTALYRNLRPVAIGLIAGESVAVFGFMLVGLIARYWGVELPSFKMLPN